MGTGMPPHRVEDSAACLSQGTTAWFSCHSVWSSLKGEINRSLCWQLYHISMDLPEPQELPGPGQQQAPDQAQGRAGDAMNLALLCHSGRLGCKNHPSTNNHQPYLENQTGTAAACLSAQAFDIQEQAMHLVTREPAEPNQER